jgi:hypothetical protein
MWASFKAGPIVSDPVKSPGYVIKKVIKPKKTGFDRFEGNSIFINPVLVSSMSEEKDHLLSIQIFF